MSIPPDSETNDSHQELADDLVMDAILQGHHLDRKITLESRIQQVMDDVNTSIHCREDSPSSGKTRSHRLARQGVGAAIAAAVLLAAGLTMMLVITKTPTATASLDQTLRLIEREDLTFRLELTKEHLDNPTKIDLRSPRYRKSSRRSGRSAPPIEHFDGAALHVRGPKYVLLGDRDRARGLAKGFDGDALWTNGPKPPRSNDNPEGGDSILGDFFELITLDLHELIRDLREGYEVEIMGLESVMIEDGVERQLVHHRADRRDLGVNRLPLQIHLWTDSETGRLEALDCRGVRLRGLNETYKILLTLESDAQLPDNWFDRERHLPDPERGNQRPREHDGPRIGDPFPPPFPPFAPPHPPQKNGHRGRGPIGQSR